MARTTLVDGEEGGFGSSVDADLDPMLDTQETLAKTAEAAAAARPSQKALYVPSPLPMGELKNALARDAVEEATAAPTLPPPPRGDASLATETPLAVLHPAAPHAPPPGLERKIDRRFDSVVDSEEARALGARVNARANAIAAARGIKAHPQPLPLPSLDQFAPIVPVPIQPVISVDAAAKAASPKKKGRFATAMLFLVAILLGGAAIAAALGKLTKDNAYRALTTVRGAAIHVAQAAQRL